LGLFMTSQEEMYISMSNIPQAENERKTDSLKHGCKQRHNNSV